MTNEPTRKRAIALGALGAVLAVAAALRLFRLAAKSFWIDEIIRLTWAKGQECTRFFDVRPAEIGTALPALDFRHVLQIARLHNPPLNALVLNFWLRATGAESDFMTRLPSAIAGILAVAGVYLWARELFDGRVALLGALLVAVSPQLIHLSQEANHYALPLCLQAFATWFYFRMLRTRSWRDEIAFSLLSLLALFGHYYCLFVLFAQAVALIWLRRHERREWIKLWTAAAPAGALAAYLALNRQQLAEMTDPAVMGSHPALPYFFDRSGKNLIEPWIAEMTLPVTVIVLLLVLILFLAARGARDAGDERRQAALVVAMLPFGVSMAAFWITGKNSILWSRYHSFFAPALLVMVAAGGISFPRRTVRAGLAAALVCIAVIGIRWYSLNARMEDWRGAAQLIDAAASAQDSVVIVPVNTTYALARYLKHDLPLFGADAEPGYFKQLITRALNGPAVWTVFAWENDGVLQEKVRAELSCKYPLREDFELHQMHVSRYHGGSDHRPATQSNRCAGLTAQ